MRPIALALLGACAAPPGVKDAGLFGDESIIAAEIMKFGFPGTESLHYRTSYVLSYDAARRVPRWVAERLDPAALDGEVKAELRRFRPDDELADAIRTRNEDYADSGYVRGRLASAANHQGDPRGFPGTYLLSNVAPQLGAEFRQTVWVELESAVRAWARTSDYLFVITGTLYLAPEKERSVTYELIGPRNVAVPTHFYKVLLREKDKERSMVGFLVPHAPTPAGTDLSTYIVPIDRLEDLSGLDFFPELTNPTQRELEKSKPAQPLPLTK
ncbi:MAG: DNA/RNA non-specific endonuclease [Planctomycetota bacterium]|jgi:endonuclease G